MGEDIKEGEVVLKEGRVLRPQDLAIMHLQDTVEYVYLKNQK